MTVVVVKPGWQQSTGVMVMVMVMNLYTAFSICIYSNAVYMSKGEIGHQHDVSRDGSCDLTCSVVGFSLSQASAIFYESKK